RSEGEQPDRQEHHGGQGGVPGGTPAPVPRGERQPDRHAWHKEQHTQEQEGTHPAGCGRIPQRAGRQRPQDEEPKRDERDGGGWECAGATEAAWRNGKHDHGAWHEEDQTGEEEEAHSAGPRRHGGTSRWPPALLGRSRVILRLHGVVGTGCRVHPRVMPRVASGRCGSRAWWRSAAAVLTGPARHSAPMTRLRKAARTWGAVPVRTWEA